MPVSTSSRAAGLLSLLTTQHLPPHRLEPTSCPPPNDKLLAFAANGVGSHGSVPRMQDSLPVTAQGHPMRHFPVMNTFYHAKPIGKTGRMASMRQPFDSDDACPEHLKVSMLQARALNPEYWLAEEGERCASFCRAHCISRVGLDRNATLRAIARFSEAFPELARMNVEFAYAYVRQLHYLEVAQMLGVEHFAVVDADVLVYTPAAHLIGHFRDQGLEVAYCTMFPHTANNVYSYFSTAALRDMLRFAAATVEEGKSWGGSGDMGWLLSYAAAFWPRSRLECTWGGFGERRRAPGAVPTAENIDWHEHEVRHVGKCEEAYKQRLHGPSPGRFRPRFQVGNPCRRWDNGVGVESIAVDREQVYAQYQPDAGGWDVGHRRIVWLRGLPHMVRNDTNQLERVWSLHFQGANKQKMAHYLRRYDVAGCVAEFAAHCDCRDAKCESCDPGPKCGFNPSISPSRPTVPWHKRISRAAKAQVRSLFQ